MATEETPAVQTEATTPASVPTNPLEPAAPAPADSAPVQKSKAPRAQQATPKPAPTTAPKAKAKTPAPKAASSKAVAKPGKATTPKPAPKPTPTPKTFTLAGVDHVSKAAAAKSLGLEPRLLRRALRKGGGVDGAVTKLRAKRDALAAELATLDAMLAALTKAS